MARTTKIELQQALNALGAEVQALRLENAQLKADNTRLNNAIALAAGKVAAAKPAYVPRPPSAEQLALRAAMAAAKALAMKTGHSVRVGA